MHLPNAAAIVESMATENKASAVAVFCSAGNGVNPAYREAAVELTQVVLVLLRVFDFEFDT